MKLEETIEALDYIKKNYIKKDDIREELKKLKEHEEALNFIHNKSPFREKNIAIIDFLEFLLEKY